MIIVPGTKAILRPRHDAFVVRFGTLRTDGRKRSISSSSSSSSSSIADDEDDVVKVRTIDGYWERKQKFEGYLNNEDERRRDETMLMMTMMKRGTEKSTTTTATTTTKTTKKKKLCTVCKGETKCTCDGCDGQGWLNECERTTNGLIEWDPDWCGKCRGGGKIGCFRCFGTGARRERIGFRLPGMGDDDDDDDDDDDA